MSQVGLSVRLLAASAIVAGTAFLVSCTWNSEPASGSRSSQGWTADQQDEWYSATQGSRLIPESWLEALEQAESSARFLDDANVERFRLLPRPGRLPVGFAVDDNDDTDLGETKLHWFDGQKSKERWVGLNCSACHTAELQLSGQRFRVDGGPSLFDFQSFVEAFDSALHVTLGSANAQQGEGQAKWRRFAARALGPNRDTDANRAMLKTALASLVARQDRAEALNATPLRYGFGRVDAFGHIFNKVALAAAYGGAAEATPNPADAPVSYPFLWDIWRQDKVQWNGIVENQRVAGIDVGAMGRNSGEVIGVFGDVVVRPNAGLGGYKSSVWADNLDRLERRLATLKAPKWPAAFGTFGDTGEGEALFADKCAGCHKPQPGNARYKVTMVPQTRENLNSTDPWMACNAISRRSAPGLLNGTRENYFGNGPRYTGEDALLASMLATTVKGALAGKKGQIIAQAGRVYLGVGTAPRVVTEEAPDLRPFQLQACFDSNSPLMAYKARPLDGIWATAPYLHNGSVASLEQILQPPAMRFTSFSVGTREYDPVNVGYRTDPAAPGNGFLFDTRLPGNSNKGHDYGVAALTPAQRKALLDHMKSL